MDLKPFYDLRICLHAGAVSGAALAVDDFRLARTLEALAPLERTAPVFQKLGQSIRALLSFDCPDRAGALLDALSLADAIACTQGAVAVPGIVKPLPLTHRGRVITNAPYSVLAPLLEALTTSGSGKFSFVLNTHKERPELFEDYRVKDALVKALGASYIEMARKAEEWLCQEDESILPLVQNDFDAKGSKEMVRRVHVIEEIAKASANNFYLKQLPIAEGNVRAALIYALRWDIANVERLIQLCQTEKGKCKDAAHYALAILDAPAAWDYWDGLAAKKPEKAAAYMILSTTKKGSEVVATILDRWLSCFEKDINAPLEYSKHEQLQTLIYALPGKSGPAICDVYRRMAALGSALDFKNVEHAPGNKTMVMRLSTNTINGQKNGSFRELVPEILRLSILFHPTPDLLSLAEELEEDYPGRFTAAQLTAALLSKSANEVWELIKLILDSSLTSFGEKKQKEAYQALLIASNSICWDEKEQRQALFDSYQKPFSHDTQQVYIVHQPLWEPLDSRIYEAFLNHLNLYDKLLIALIPTVRDKTMRFKIGEQLYKYALTHLNNDNWPQYLQGLRECYWPRCEGLAVKYCHNFQLTPWKIQYFLEQMPGNAAAKLKEAEEVYDLARSGKLSLHSIGHRVSAEFLLASLQEYIEKLRMQVKL